MENRLHSAANIARALARDGVGLRWLQGALKGTGRHVSMTFVGDALHAEECREFLEGPTHVSMSAVADPDVALIGEPFPLPFEGALRYHPFLDALLDVRPSVEAQIQAVRSKAHRRRLRQVSRSHDWKWTVAEQPEDLVRFYTHVHLPYVRCRFGERARIDPLPHLVKQFEKGGRVLTVTNRGEAVCGAVLFEEPGALVYDRNGFRLDVLNRPQLLAERTAALELAIFQFVQEVSASVLDLGFCRALLNDGLFTHKRRLGCHFVPMPGTGPYQLWVRPELRPEFFSAFPMVVGPCGEFQAHLGCLRGKPPLRKTLLRALLKNFALPSVRGAVVWTNAPADDPARKAFDEALHRALGSRPVQVHET